MPDTAANLDQVGDVVHSLTKEDFRPVLVGGMALVILGSQRITRDFDFVITKPGDRLGELVDILYDRGFELASRVNDEGQIRTTIDNRRVATIRIRLDSPASVFFFNRRTGVRLDLLFDFPIPAETLADRASTIKVRSHVLTMASEDDLLKLKRIAQRGRRFAGDAQDIEFLEARRRSRKA
jgi:hypothetical protein